MGDTSPLISLHNNWEVSSPKKFWLFGFPTEGSLPGRSHGEANAKHAAVSSPWELEWRWHFSKHQQSAPGTVFSPPPPSLRAVLASQRQRSVCSIRITAGNSLVVLTGRCHKWQIQGYAEKTVAMPRISVPDALSSAVTTGPFSQRKPCRVRAVSSCQVEETRDLKDRRWL